MMQGTGTHPGLQDLMSHEGWSGIGSFAAMSHAVACNRVFTIPAENATPANGSRASAMVTASSRCLAGAQKVTNSHCKILQLVDGRNRGMTTEPSTRAAGLPI